MKNITGLPDLLFNNVDIFRGCILDENENVIQKQTNVCYNSCIYGDMKIALRKPEAKWYDVYFADNVSEITGNIRATKRALKLLQTTGIFRKMQVTTMKRTPEFDKFLNIFVKASYPLPKQKVWLRVRADVDNCTADEMFFVGCIIRDFANDPRSIITFLNLYNKQKKNYETSLLYQAAHILTFLKDPIQVRGHYFIYNSTTALSGKTFQDNLDRIDEKVKETIRKAEYYNRLGVEPFFMEGNLPRTYDRAGGCFYSSRALKSLFDLSLYNKLKKVDKRLVSIL